MREKWNSQIDYYYSANLLYAYLGLKKSGMFINYRPFYSVTLMFDNANLFNLDDLAKITNLVGLNADKLIEASNLKDILDSYNKNTEEVVAMCVFGSPTL